MADLFNAFNSNASVGAASNAGEPLNILHARYWKSGAQLQF